MILLLFVAVNSALLGRALFLQLQAVFGWYNLCYMICLNEDGLEHWIKTWLELPRADHSKIGIKAEYFNCLSPTTDI